MTKAQISTEENNRFVGRASLRDALVIAAVGQECPTYELMISSSEVERVHPGLTVIARQQIFKKEPGEVRR